MYRQLLETFWQSRRPVALLPPAGASSYLPPDAQAESRFSFDVKLPTSIIRDELLDYLPKPLLNDVYRTKIWMLPEMLRPQDAAAQRKKLKQNNPRLAHLLSSMRQSNPLLNWLAEANEARLDLENRIAQDLASITVEINYTAEVEQLDLKVRGNRLSVQLLLRFKISTSVDALLATVPFLSVGQDQQMPRVVLVMGTDVAWAPGGKLAFTNKNWKLRWVQRPYLSRLGIDLAEVVRLLDVRHMVERFMDQQITGSVPGSLSMLFLLDYFWDAFSSPIELDEKIWLAINPLRLTTSEIEGQGKEIRTRVGVHCRPQVWLGPSPPSTDTSLPPVLNAEDDDEFRLVLRAEFSLYQLSKMLMKQLSEHQGPDAPVRITRVELKAIGQQLAVEIDFEKPIAGKLRATGRPVFLPETNRVFIQDLDFELVEAHWLSRAINWLAHNRIRSFVARNLHFSLDETMAEALGYLGKFDIDVANSRYYNFRLGVQVGQLRVLALHLDDSKLQLWIGSRGQAQLRIRRRDRKLKELPAAGGAGV